MRSPNRHWTPDKAGVVSQSKSKLGCGAQPRQEYILKIDKGGVEDAVKEGIDQGPREDVGRPAGEGRENIERVELYWEEPLAGGVPDGHRVHHVPYDGVVQVRVRQRSVLSLDGHRGGVKVGRLQGFPDLFSVHKYIVVHLMEIIFTCGRQDRKRNVADNILQEEWGRCRTKKSSAKTRGGGHEPSRQTLLLGNLD